jgi:large subunit ribosomal protein L16
VLPGKILFEMNGVSKEQAQEAFERAAHKLPFKTRFLVRE